MTKLTTSTQIHKLQERYPFNEEELEILVRCHDRIRDAVNNDDYLMQLATSSPYTYYFLPGEEMKERINWLEDRVLPMGFPNKLRAAVSADPFVAYANEGEVKSLERFLEGIADTGRRGPKEALHILYEIVGDEPTAEELIDLCFRLSVASGAMVVPNLDKEACLQRIVDAENKIRPLVRSLNNAKHKDGIITRKIFVEWAETTVPLLSAPFSTFVHRLLFHSSPYPKARVPYSHPKLDNASDIFTNPDCPSLFSLSLTTRHFSGKVCKINQFRLRAFQTIQSC